MKMAVGLDVDGSVEAILERARDLAGRGFRSLWSSQIFGPDTLTVLAVVGRELPELDLGTAVVPVQPRHPTMLAAQARTVQAMIGGRLSLGVGLSHRMVVEDMWGLDFSRPVTYMSEYLDALAPLVRGESVNVRGERVRAVTMGALGPREAGTPSVLVAALGERMLDLAGEKADGTVLWMTGHRTIASHIVPHVSAAAARAGRRAPRVVCSAPVVVTADVPAARQRVDAVLKIYGTLPSYQAMLQREGAQSPADVSLIGSAEQVREQLGEYASAGVTEFSAALVGSREEREVTLDLLSEMV